MIESWEWRRHAAQPKEGEVRSQLNLQSLRMPGQLHYQAYMSSGAKTDEISYEISVTDLGHRILGYTGIRAMF
jgi:hypothetical protein